MHPKVVVEDIDVDAALVDYGAGNTLLVLRPGQTFGSAVRAVRRTLPTMHPNQARQLVRQHLPDATDIDSILGSVPPIPTPRPSLARKHPRSMWIAGASLAAVLLVLGTWGMVDTSSDSPSAQPRTAPAVSSMISADHAEAAAARDRLGIAALGGSCLPIADGISMCHFPQVGRGQVETHTAPNEMVYRFTFGDEGAVVHSFDTADQARVFVDENSRMYTHVERLGPYVIAGTSAVIIRQVGGLIQQASRATHTSLS